MNTKKNGRKKTKKKGCSKKQNYIIHQRTKDNIARVRDKKTNIVVNLSDRILTLTEEAVLNKGLNFCVTSENPKPFFKKLISEVDNVIRTLQIKYMFANREAGAIEKFTGNPNWNPPASHRNVALDGYGSFLKQNIKNIVVKNKTKQNISKIERAALNSLKSDKNILIMKADKGGSVCVVNTNSYKEKMLDMLSDSKTYTITDNVDLKQSKEEVDKLFNFLYHQGFISKRQHRHFLQNRAKLPVLYGLPKIHKLNWPLRPICSQIDSPTYKLSKFVDYLLTTAEKSIPNLLQDTTRFLQLLKTLAPTTENTILFTIDVTSLYTVLPHKMVVDYVVEMYEETLENWAQYTPELKPVTGNTLKRMIKIILSQTFFQFDDKIYIQKLGITMGSSASVKLANITLHKHLIKIIKMYSGTLPNIQLRLIDDVFGTFSGTETELLDFVAHLNNSHDTIKFTIDHSKVQIPFLDTLVYIENQTIKTKLYKKATDNKQYLHFNSEHPQHMKKSIPYAQAVRYKRIIEDEDVLKEELMKLRDNFTSRLYPLRTIQTAIDKVAILKREDLIQYKTKIENNWNFTAFVLTFNNALVNNKDCNIYKLISESWNNLITTAPELTNMNLPKIVFQKCQTINSILVSSVFPPPRWNISPRTPNGILENNNEIALLAPTIYRCTRCTSKRCLTCDNILATSRFYSTNSKNYYNLSTDMNCDSENVIYLVTCNLCGLQYVGETGMKLRDRITVHRSCIKTRKATPLGIHFNSKGHSVTDMQIVTIEQLPNNNNYQRKTRELFWQLTLDTVFPRGLNAYPVNNPHFRDLKITKVTDLEMLWTYFCNDDSE